MNFCSYLYTKLLNRSNFIKKQTKTLHNPVCGFESLGLRDPVICKYYVHCLVSFRNLMIWFIRLIF